MHNFLNRAKTCFLPFLLCLYIFLLYTPFVYSENPKPIVQTIYTDTYTLDQSRDVRVSREIQITKKTDQLSLSEYYLQIAGMKLVNDLNIYEGQSRINYELVNSEGRQYVKIVFNEPLREINQTKNLRVEYVLKNYLNYSGLSRELFVPLNKSSELEQITGYEVRVKTPADYPPYGFSKPRVSETNPQEYKWINLMNTDSRMLYLSLSDKAYYRVSLNYTLLNNTNEQKQVSIPLVPDGIMQKVYLENLLPEPDRVYLDNDANFMAVYNLEPNSVLPIQLQTYVELFTQPRVEVKNYWQEKFRSTIKNRYLTLEDYWSINPTNLVEVQKSDLDTAGEIYRYVINKLDYDSTRINSDLKRMGADWAISNPERAVCAEYTDLYVALARENGIPAREVVGYAVTADQSYLPSSFLGDILHAWPERYDSARETWLPLDPTWGDTSGLDYFGSFDLSHISFVYHGQNPNFPLPPGVYKIDPKVKDVSVVGTSEPPPSKTNVLLVTSKNDTFLVSEANHFLYNQHLYIKTVDGKLLSEKVLPVVEPFSRYRIEFPRNSGKMLSSKQRYKVFLNNRQIGESTQSSKSVIDSYILPIILIGMGIASLAWFKWH